jgi:hypothetical protein
MVINVNDFSTLNDRFYNDLNQSQTSNNGVEVIDFIVTWCAKANVEVESIASLVKANNAFKGTLLKEAKVLNLMKKE